MAQPVLPWKRYLFVSFDVTIALVRRYVGSSWLTKPR